MVAKTTPGPPFASNCLTSSIDTATVTVILGGTTVWMGSHLVRVHDVWDVGTITYPGATFTPVDTVTDCNAAWHGGGSMGCGLMIP